VLLASGLIAGEALIGLVFAAIAFFNDGRVPNLCEKFFNISKPSYLISVAIFVGLGYLLVKLPLANAGDPNEPAAPAVM